MDKYELYKFESEDKNNRRVWRIYYGIDTGLKNPNQQFKYGAHTLDGSYGIVLKEYKYHGSPDTVLKGTTSDKTNIELTMKQFNALSDISIIPSDIIDIDPTKKFKDAVKGDKITFKERQFSRDIFAKAVSKYYKNKRVPSKPPAPSSSSATSSS